MIETVLTSQPVEPGLPGHGWTLKKLRRWVESKLGRSVSRTTLRNLLTKFGDHRQRFPAAASVQALAGTCPVTDQSGKRKLIKFRTSGGWRPVSLMG